MRSRSGRSELPSIPTNSYYLKLFGGSSHSFSFATSERAGRRYALNNKRSSAGRPPPPSLLV